MESLAFPPRITDFTRPHFDGLREGRLLTTRCRACAKITFPPKFLCPECWSQSVEWVALRGTGTLCSFTRVHVGPAVFSRELPYILGIVDLDEGVRCLARINDPFEDLSCDVRVHIAVRPALPAPLLAFELERNSDEVRPRVVT